MDLEQLKAVLNKALGDQRFSDVDPDEPLLAAGLITSIEVVMLSVAVEKAASRALSPVGANAWTLNSLLAMARGEEVSAEAAPRRESGLTASLRRATVSPARMALALVLVFVVLNLGLEGIMRTVLRNSYNAFLEDGQRLHPAGVLSEDDFAFAVKFHRIMRPAAPGQQTVLVLGDSHTYGLHLFAEETWPAAMERALVRQGVNVRVMNLSWFGQVVAEELMLLDTVWDRPYQTVIICFGDNWPDRVYRRTWTQTSPAVNVNLPLLYDFMKKVPADERKPFEAVADELEAGDRMHWGPWRRLLFAVTPMAHYAPYFNDWYQERLLPRFLGMPLVDKFKNRNLRCCMDPLHPSRVIAKPWYFKEVTPDRYDADSVAMLGTAMKMLRARGIRVILYLEPSRPQEWGPPDTRITARAIADSLSKETGCEVVDMTARMPGRYFTDNFNHLIPQGYHIIGEEVAKAWLKSRP